jgi:hypothetical protein
MSSEFLSIRCQPEKKTEFLDVKEEQSIFAWFYFVLGLVATSSKVQNIYKLSITLILAL